MEKKIEEKNENEKSLQTFMKWKNSFESKEIIILE